MNQLSSNRQGIDQLRAALADAVGSSAAGPIFVHADLMQASYFVERAVRRSELLASHIELLQQIAENRPLWFACFNYDYTRTHAVDLRDAPCQVGPLGDHVRQSDGAWRTGDPVFSACGVGDAPNLPPPQSQFRAFSDQSIFEAIYRNDATILFYGAPMSSATIIHYAEYRAGGPVYRYDKHFAGRITDSDGVETELDYIYHVRPLGRHLDYDWPRLTDELQSAGVGSHINHGKRTAARVFGARELVDFWAGRLAEDPFALLDEESREWAAPLYQQKGRRFELADFE